MNNIRFALDYDGTFTAAPDLWDRFVVMAREAGHSVVCVTARRDTEENREMLRAELDRWIEGLPLFLTSLSSKKDYMEKIGVRIDIWIDDDPRVITEGF